jgi:hypothetical protein
MMTALRQGHVAPPGSARRCQPGRLRRLPMMATSSMASTGFER